MTVINAERVELCRDDNAFFRLNRHENPMLEDETNRFIQFDVPLVYHQEVTMCLVVLGSRPHLADIYTLTAILFVVLAMSLPLFMMYCWLNR